MVNDILYDSDGDLAIDNGDFVIGDSTAQAIEDLLLTEKGNLRSSPAAGVGVKSWINDDEDSHNMEKEIQKELEADGMKVIANANGVVDAVYK